MQQEIKRLSNSYVDLKYQQGIVYATYKKIDRIDLDAAKTLVRDRKIISDNTVSPLFIDGREVNKITKEARKYLGSSEASELIAAAALYTDSSFGKFLANFLLKVNWKQTPIPMKFFNNKEEAIRWLKSYQ